MSTRTLTTRDIMFTIAGDEGNEPDDWRDMVESVLFRDSEEHWSDGPMRQHHTVILCIDGSHWRFEHRVDVDSDGTPDSDLMDRLHAMSRDDDGVLQWEEPTGHDYDKSYDADEVHQVEETVTVWRPV